MLHYKPSLYRQSTTCMTDSAFAIASVGQITPPHKECANIQPLSNNVYILTFKDVHSLYLLM